MPTYLLPNYIYEVRTNRLFAQENNIRREKFRGEKKIMKPLRKRVLTTTTLILILTMAALMASMPPASAADVPSYAFLTVLPNPVGVNEQVFVSMFLSEPPPTAAGAQGDRWQGYTVTITKPDGSTEQMGPYTSDAVSGAGFPYVPNQVGTYKFRFRFPGQHIVGEIPSLFGGPGTPIDNNYLPADSREVQLVVTQEPSPKWPEVPVPNYWQRPLYGENRELASIGGNWLMPAYAPAAVTGGAGIARAFDWGAAYAPNNKAPGSAHILWTKPMTFGGLVGNEMPSVTYYTSLSYEQLFKPPVIINGYLYYNLHKSTYGYAPYNRPGFVCVDIATGEEVYRNMEAWIDFGQIYDYESPNQHGAFGYLWMINGTTMTMMDAFSGERILDITNAPAPGGMFGSFLKMSPVGELWIYVLDPVSNTLARWNSYKAIGPYLPTGSEAWQWRPYTKGVVNGANGYDWNVSVAAANMPGLAIAQIGPGDVIYAGAGGGFLAPYGNHMWAGFNINDGALLWTSTITRPASIPGSSTGPIGEGIYTEYTRQTKQWNGYDIMTGQHLWTTEPYEDDWMVYGTYTGQMIADGMLIHAGYDGYIHAFDVKTGAILWNYYSGNAGSETPYGTYPFYGGFVYAEGKIFGHTSEHSPGTPMWRGEQLHAVRASDGVGLWKISGWFQHPAVVDGKLLSLNGYDNRIYCFGKGPSATTVSAPQTAVPKGTTVLITGTVTDQSPEVKGTPAVSDGEQEKWMEYLYMQKECPATVTGVTVAITAKAADGSTTNIGTATSDGSGLFKITWTPENEGVFTITATFAGTESYGNSLASTAIVVSAAPAGGTTTTTTAAPIDLYIIAATIVILIAIALATLVLRKKA